MKNPSRSITILDLPEALLIDILQRLPSATIFTCRNVCKAWRKVLSDPHFLNTLLLSRSCLLVKLTKHVEPDACPKKLCLLDLESPHRDDPIILNPNFDQPYGHLEVRNTCDGLLCLSRRHTGACKATPTIILNPLTTEYIAIPPNTYDLKILDSLLGYSPSTNQYKVVRFLSDSFLDRRWIEVYTLGTGEWQYVYASFEKLNFKSSSCAILNGSIYWVDRQSWSIGAFNFEVGKLHNNVLLPPVNYNHLRARGFTSVGVLGCRLCVSISEDPSHSGFGIWVMNTYGEPWSWTKKFTVGRGSLGHTLSIMHCQRRTRALGSGELLGVSRLDYLVAYNLKEQSYEVVHIPGITTCEVFPYTPSLISLKNIASVEVVKVLRS